MKKVLVATILEKKDNLEKELYERIENAHFAEGYIDEEGLFTGKTREEFEILSMNEYETIQQKIRTYWYLVELADRAAATTYLNTGYGKMTVSRALKMRDVLQNLTFSDEDFFKQLIMKLNMEYVKTNHGISEITFQKHADKIRDLSDELGNFLSKREMESLEQIELSMRQKTGERFDPLDINERLKENIELRKKLPLEITEKIKLSNESSYLEVSDEEYALYLV